MRIKGFSTIEITVVLVVIAILAVVGYNTYTSLSSKVSEAEASTTMKVVINLEKIFYTSNNFFATEGDELKGIENAYNYYGKNIAVEGATDVSVGVVENESGEEILVIAVEAKGNCVVAEVLGGEDAPVYQGVRPDGSLASCKASNSSDWVTR